MLHHTRITMSFYVPFGRQETTLPVDETCLRHTFVVMQLHDAVCDAGADFSSQGEFRE